MSSLSDSCARHPRHIQQDPQHSMHRNRVAARFRRKQSRGPEARAEVIAGRRVLGVILFSSSGVTGKGDRAKNQNEVGPGSKVAFLG
jgi:hypothetical protein